MRKMTGRAECQAVLAVIADGEAVRATAEREQALRQTPMVHLLTASRV
jgi:hypothetical protein